MTTGVTIGRAAAFAGVTVKTIRHYHKLGLLDEPPRDGSGYRRYGPVELLRLVRVRAFAAAGVPLARIGPLLDAPADRIERTLSDLDGRLTAQIAELRSQRESLRRLGDGDRALLPERAIAVLERARGLGFGPDELTAYRDGLVLARALAPDTFDEYVARVHRALDDGAFIALIKRTWEATEWSPHDPRIDRLADQIVEHFRANPQLRSILTALHPRPDVDPDLRVLDEHAQNQSVAWVRLTALIETGMRATPATAPPPR